MCVQYEGRRLLFSSKIWNWNSREFLAKTKAGRCLLQCTSVIASSSFFFFKSNIPKKRFFSGLDVWTSGLLNFVLNMEFFFLFLFLGLVEFCLWRKQTILIGFENVMAMVTFFKWKNNEAILCQHYLYTQGNRNNSDFFLHENFFKIFFKRPPEKRKFF